MNAILRAVGLRANEHMVNFTNCWSMKCTHPGADVEVLQAALRIAGFEAEVDPKNHPTAEAVDMIANETADLTVHTIIQKVERMARVDFTLPINYFVYGYLTKEVDDVQVEDFIMTSVNPWLYPFIYGAAIIYAILMVFMSRSKVDKSHKLLALVILLSEGLLEAANENEECTSSSRITQNTEYFSLNTRTAVLFSTWTWFCFFLAIFYESSMKSRMTLTGKKGYIFENLNGVLNAVERHGWTIIVDNGGYDPIMFCREEYKECRTRIEKLRPDFVRRETAFSGLSIEDVLAKVPKLIYFTGLQTDYLHGSIAFFRPEKRLLFIREPALPQQMLAFAISKKIPHVRRLLNKALAAMQSSYGTFAARYRLPLRLYNRSDSRKEFYVLSFLYIWPLFRIMFFCLTISFIILILENIFARLSKIHEIFQCVFMKIECCGLRIVHPE